MDPSSIVPIVSATASIAALIVALRNRADVKSKHVMDTLAAINTASKETLKYEAYRDENQGKRIRDREIEISANWYTASNWVRVYDEPLAARIEMKGEYWDNPTIWDQLEISDARIGLEQIVRETDQLLKYRV